MEPINIRNIIKDNIKYKIYEYKDYTYTSLGLSIDFGGTTIKCSIMDQDANFIIEYSFKTIYKDIYINLDNICNYFNTALKILNIDKSLFNAYSIGVPGPVNNNIVEYMINVGIDKSVNIIEYLSNKLSLEGYLYNDTHASGIGEFEIRNTSWNKAEIMLGTGIGVCTYNGNEELGHKIILDYEEKRYDNQGICNSIESYCSQIGIKNTYKKYCKEYNINYDDTLLIEEIFNSNNKASIKTKEDFINIHLIDGIIGLLKLYPDTKEVILGGGISNGINIKDVSDKVNYKLNKNIIISKAIFTNGPYGLNRTIFDRNKIYI